MGIINATLAASIVSFLILLFLLSRFVYPRLVQILEERTRRIEDAIRSAEADREAAAKLKEEFERQLASARAEAQAFLERAEKTAAVRAEEIVNQARADAERVKQAALAEIEAEKRKAIQAIQDEVVDLAVRVAQKVLETKLDAAEQERLVRQFLVEVGAEQ